MSTAARQGKWFAFVFIMTLVGLIASFLALRHHVRLNVLGYLDSFCAINDVVQCERTVTSPYATILGLPLGAWGIAYFSALGLMLALAWRQGSAQRYALVRGIWLVTVVGLVVSVGLTTIAVTELRTLCPVCLGAHGANLMLFVTMTIFINRNSGKPADRSQSIKLAALPSVAALSMAIVAVLGYGHGLPLLAHAFVQKGDERAAVDGAPNACQPGYRPYAAKGAVIGPRDAAVTLTEYVDFHCPSCAAFQSIADKLRGRFPTDLRIEIRHFPADTACNEAVKRTTHTGACDAAAIFECIADEIAAEDAMEIMFDPDVIYADKPAQVVAAKLGLNHDELERCSKSDAVLQRIRRDVKDAAQLGVTRTPGLAVDGWAIKGESFKASAISTLVRSRANAVNFCR